MNSITFLGTGTSGGVPMIGCDCPVCKSTDYKDKRLRTSAYIEYEGLKLVIDAGPDFRQQMLREGIGDFDAVLLTHKHKDHTGGLDDLRSINYFHQKNMPIYCEQMVLSSLKMEYSYAFSEDRYPGAPRFDIHLIEDRPFTINGVEIVPLRVLHYKMPIFGYKFGKLAYITDASYMPQETRDLLQDIDLLVINSIHHKPHISHFCVSQAIEESRKTSAKKTYLTHFSHQVGFNKVLEETLPEGILPAYDGLKLTF